MDPSIKLISKALSLLNHGKNWIKHESRYEYAGGVVKYCALGALHEACESIEPDKNNLQYRDSYCATICCMFDEQAQKRDASDMVHFNDREKTTFVDVEEVFKAVIANLEDQAKL